MKSSIHLSLRSTTTWILLVPAYIHGFLNFSRISNDRPPSNNMRAVHISTCPTNAPNKWRKLQKKHHMVDVTLCHMNISPRPVHAGLVSSIESSQTDFIWGGGSDLLEPVSGSSGFWDISEIKISIQRSSRLLDARACRLKMMMITIIISPLRGISLLKIMYFFKYSKVSRQIVGGLD